MKHTVNHLIKLAGILSTCFAVAAYADYDHDHSNASNAQNKNNKVYREITPPAGPQVSNGTGFGISANFIYWEAREENLGWVQSGDTIFTQVGQAATLAQGKVYNPGFQYEPGFKVGAHAETGHDNWDVRAEYTWLHSSDKVKSIPSVAGTATSTYAPLGITLTEYYATLNSAREIIRGNSRWFHRLNMVDLDLGRSFYLSEHLAVRPAFGLRGAWNKQRRLNTIIDTQTASASAAAEQLVKDSQETSYWGVGFKYAMDTTWFIDENWAIYGDASFSGLWSKHDTTLKLRNMTANTVYVNTNEVVYGLVPITDLEMGIRWMMGFDEDAYQFMLQAGWDQQAWFGYNHLTPERGLMSMQGLNIKARFDF